MRWLMLAGVLAPALAACDTTVTPADTSAGKLDVRISVIGSGASGSTLPVVMQFLSNGSAVQFTAGETVSCNGVTLDFNGLVVAYAGRAPVLPPGGTYTFVYKRMGTNTSVVVTVPPNPVILTPAVGATVIRTASLTLTYVPDSGASIRGGAGDPATGLSGNTQPDTGTYTGLNVTSMKPGPGTVDIVREFVLSPLSTGFKSAQTTYDASGTNAVTWQ